MTFCVRYTKVARDDLHRLYEYLLERDLSAARRARDAIGKGIDFLRDFPFSCRKAMPDNSFIRELVIPFGGAGYVALFEIESDQIVTILAIRHQREEDYY